jgi:hypothetical protein
MAREDEVPDRDEMVRNFVTMSGASEELVSITMGVDCYASKLAHSD